MKNKLSGLYVAEIKRKYKDKVYVTYLLRRSYRQDGKVKQQTVANITHYPPHTRELIRHSLRGVNFVPLNQGFEITKSRLHGHVLAVRAMVHRIGLDEIISPKPSRERDLIEALLVSRVVNAETKVSTTRWWHTTTLPEDLGILDATEDDVYQAMDWLLERQPEIEARLAERHLTDGSLVLYDVSSSYYEGRHCPLAVYGYNRDKKKGKRQIVYGLMVDKQGCPVAVEVFAGNTGDPSTIEAQITKVKERFKLKRVIFAGDRGMLTDTQIDKLREIKGFDWVSALRAPAIRRLLDQGVLQPSLFDSQDLMEITSEEYPGERLVVCYNPYLAEDRARTREELLKATENRLDSLARRVASGRLRLKEKIGEALGRIANKHKMAKHFEFTVAEGRFAYRRKTDEIEKEASLDGFYVLRTSVDKQTWAAEDVIRGYKSLSHAERAFRTLKSVDMKVRPIHHWVSDRVRAHVFVCMLAYYLKWHLRQAWKALTFDDEEPGLHEAGSPVRPALRSPGALRKARYGKREDGSSVHSLRTLLAHLGTIVRNEVRIPALPEMPPFKLETLPDPLQSDALARVGYDWTAENFGRQNSTS